MTLGVGFYADAEAKAPGAWAGTSPGVPQPQTNNRASAAETPYNKAMAVLTRSAAKLVISSQTCPLDGTSIKLVDRVKGRAWIRIGTPSASTTGFYLMSSAESNVVDQAGAFLPLVPAWHFKQGDASIELDTEAGLWIATDTLGTGTIVQVIEGINLESDWS